MRGLFKDMKCRPWSRFQADMKPQGVRSHLGIDQK